MKLLKDRINIRNIISCFNIFNSCYMFIELFHLQMLYCPKNLKIQIDKYFLRYSYIQKNNEFNFKSNNIKFNNLFNFFFIL